VPADALSDCSQEGCDSACAGQFGLKEKVCIS
jgi:hypothetical protein